MYNVVITDIICPNCGEGRMVREEPRVIKSNTQTFNYSCPDCGFVQTAKSDEHNKEGDKEQMMSRLMIVEVPSYSCEFKGIREVAELVRCKDCRHRIVNEHYGEKGYMKLKAMCELDTGDIFQFGRHAEDDEWYCADGERKE